MSLPWLNSDPGKFKFVVLIFFEIQFPVSLVETKIFNQLTSFLKNDTYVIAQLFDGELEKEDSETQSTNSFFQVVVLYFVKRG